MSGTIWPVDAVAGAPSFTGRMLREAGMTPFAAGATAARPFGGISGVRPGTSPLIGSMSGLNWTITPFGGAVDGEASNLAGVYGYSFPTNQTGTINAQTGTARTDLLSVQMNDPAEGDSGLPSINIVYTVGVPGRPTSPGHGFDLYLINVPATGGGSPTLTWIGPSTVAAGGVLPVPTKAGLDLIAGYPGMYAEVTSDSNVALNREYKWNPTLSAWRGISGQRIARVNLNGTTTIDGLAATIATFDAIKLTFSATGATANDFYVRIRRGGADVSTGYANQVVYATGTSVVGTANYGGAGQFLVSAGGGTNQSGDITLVGLGSTGLILGTSVVAGYTGAAILVMTAALVLGAATTDDGFKFGRTTDPSNLAGFVDIIGI